MKSSLFPHGGVAIHSINFNGHEAGQASLPNSKAKMKLRQ
jgi:hypothetical protein